jgi:anaerobic magnesium-protoporphyrin IX monomethyl ester cyclase
MKIILCTPPFGKTDYSWPPIGLLYIASHLNSDSNHDIKVIDGYSFNIAEDIFLAKIKDENPDVLGLSCTSHTFLRSMELLEKIKQILPNVVIVLGGMHATFFAEKIVAEYRFIDFVVKGEGEFCFTKLINNLHNKKELKNVKGLAFIDGNEIVSSEGEIITDLDSLPFPDRKLVEKNEYYHNWFGLRFNFGKFTTILTSRGCPYGCIFCCCSALYKRKWRTRSVENVLDELEEIHSQGYKTCIFIDDNFTLIPERVVEICKGIVERGIKMDFHCEGRIDKMSLDIFKEMKKAGFTTVLFGLESGLQKILDYYKKGNKVEQVKKVVTDAKNAGLNVIGSFIVGAPIETEQDILDNLEYASDLRIPLYIGPLVIVPGTGLWSDLEENNRIKEDEWKSDHKVSKYYDHFTEEEISNYIDHGYSLMIKKLKRPRSIGDFTFFLSSYNLKIFLWNLYKNPITLLKRILITGILGRFPRYQK